MRKLNTLAFAVLAGMSGSCLAQAQMMSVDQSKAIEDQYIVVFKTPTVLNAANSAAISSYATSQAQALTTQHNVQVTKSFNGVLNGVVVNASKQKVQELLSNPSIDYIEQDQIVTITPMVDASADQGNAIWGLDRVDQRDLPLNSNYHYDYDGSGVTAYVIDTGVRISHAEFGGRASHGYDFVDNDADSSDCNGHGTHVAGTIGGGAYGVAKNVNVVGVRVLGCTGSGSYSGVISGINWVKDNASGPSVANMSLGGGVSQAVDDAVNTAVASGVTFVVAAGNDNSNACNYSPARAADAVTVGSTTSSDARSSFSNYGNCLDIYAPGSSIKSAWYNSDSATNTISGTSMAAPHVAGVVALYLDENPSLTPSQIDSLLSSRSSKDKVSDAKSGSPNELVFSLADSTPPPPPPTVPELDDGVAVGASGASGSETHYLFKVPAGKETLTVTLSGGTGDADLYVQQGQKATQSSYTCRPYKSGNEEVCTFNNPAAGDWYIMLHGYSAYSGASLVAATSNGNGGCGANCLENGVPVTGLSGASGSEVAYTIDVPANSTLSVEISGGTGDADLYVRKGQAPTTSTYDCRPYRNGNSETCSLTNNGGAATYHIMLRGYNNYSGVTLKGSY
ncbi:alkaline serine protease [Pseudoalteromonas luteoviolacea S2607]|uniref:S8 family peptidase n=1 Tax=Pseudoalteromonas luteoviolacea TaxID=43657 RepID=UPI0007B0A718|nr:S8 family peptidase [Pseudoalteromonas luteoviolacea]KZN29875.1 alkaline serine protease [Pseudoalteromonas luteoviolacea S2607]